MQRRKKNVPPGTDQRRASARDVLSDFPTGRRSRSPRQEAEGLVPRQLPGLLGEGPGNSPDFSPVENLWAIVKEELNKMETATSEKTLIQNVQVA